MPSHRQPNQNKHGKHESFARTALTRDEVQRILKSQVESAQVRFAAEMDTSDSEIHVRVLKELDSAVQRYIDFIQKGIIAPDIPK